MSRNPHFTLGTVAFACAGGMLADGVALAQEPRAALELEEITVTARKRSETVQEAPLSIQAYSGQQIEQRGIEDFADLAKFSSGLNFNTSTYRGSSSISIRGMNPRRKTLHWATVDAFVPFVGPDGRIAMSAHPRVSCGRVSLERRADLVPMEGRATPAGAKDCGWCP